jgi:hypothetical protein
MKKLLLSAFLIALPVVTWAQPSSKLENANKVPSNSRLEAKSKANQMAAGIMAAEAALTPAELEIAARVHLGKLPCELDAFVTLMADPQSPGYFDVHTKTQKYRMFPVETSTGAIRLEDHKAGAVWLQLANKSMLMNHKMGKRLADACMNPDQIVVAEKMLKNPAPGLLDIATEVAIK